MDIFNSYLNFEEKTSIQQTKTKLKTHDMEKNALRMLQATHHKLS
jgi:hypothetical protein